MEIYNKDPILVLWEIVKDLANEIPIYKAVMNEDNPPDSYILLLGEQTNFADKYGDGKALIRGADNNILLVSKGYAEDTTDLHNINLSKIKKVLKDKDVGYNGNDLGYSDELKSTQYSFSVEIRFIG